MNPMKQFEGDGQSGPETAHGTESTGTLTGRRREILVQRLTDSLVSVDFLRIDLSNALEYLSHHETKETPVRQIMQTLLRQTRSYRYAVIATLFLLNDESRSSSADLWSDPTVPRQPTATTLTGFETLATIDTNDLLRYVLKRFLPHQSK